MVTEAMMAALVAKLLASAPRIAPQGSVIVSNPVTCVTATKRDIGSRRYHAFACVDVAFTGDVTGAVLTKSGALVCDLDGVFDGNCLAITGCGISQFACL